MPLNLEMLFLLAGLATVEIDDDGFTLLEDECRFMPLVAEATSPADADVLPDEHMSIRTYVDIDLGF